MPLLHACGYWEGMLTFVLATAIINGRYSEPGETESPVVVASAEQVGAAVRQPCLVLVRPLP